jgi:hypothetical protein
LKEKVVMAYLKGTSLVSAWMGRKIMNIYQSHTSVGALNFFTLKLILSVNTSVNMFLEREILVITNEALATRNVKLCVEVIYITYKLCIDN